MSVTCDSVTSVACTIALAVGDAVEFLVLLSFSLLTLVLSLFYSALMVMAWNQSLTTLHSASDYFMLIVLTGIVIALYGIVGSFLRELRYTGVAGRLGYDTDRDYR